MRSTENWRRYFQFETETISFISGWRGPHVPDLPSALRLADGHAVLSHILSGLVKNNVNMLLHYCRILILLHPDVSEPKALILISANKKWNISSVRWNVSCLRVYISAQTQKYISLFALFLPPQRLDHFLPHHKYCASICKEFYCCTIFFCLHIFDPVKFGPDWC